MHQFRFFISKMIIRNRKYQPCKILLRIYIYIYMRGWVLRIINSTSVKSVEWKFGLFRWWYLNICKKYTFLEKRSVKSIDLQWIAVKHNQMISSDIPTSSAPCHAPLTSNEGFLNSWSYLPNPSARAGYDTRSIFKWSLTGLNSEFSFS